MTNTKLDLGQRIGLLRDDLTDASIWLKDRYPAERYVFAVDYYHHQKSSKDIAYVVIIGPERNRRRTIRASATRALEALGWRITPDGGGDVLDAFPSPADSVSAHKRLRAIQRVEDALRQMERL